MFIQEFLESDEAHFVDGIHIVIALMNLNMIKT